MDFLVSSLWLFLSTGFFVKALNKRFEICLPLTLIIQTFIVYFSGFINKISYGYYSTWIICILFSILIIIDLINEKRDNLKIFIKNYFTIGLVVFFFIYLYFYFLYANYGFSFWDEFMHWGVMVMETLRTNSFYAVHESLLTIHKDYPPFISLIEVLWCKLFGNVYQENLCFLGLHTFMFSLFMPLFANLKINKWFDWIKALVITLCTLLIGLTLSLMPTANDLALYYNSIYIDWVLALLCAYCLSLVYKIKTIEIFDVVNISLSASALLMAKQMGMPLFLIVIAFAIIKFTYLFIKKQITKKLFILSILSIILVPILIYLSWKSIINIYDLVGQFEVQDISYFQIIKQAITGNIEIEWQIVTHNNFIEALLHRPLVNFMNMSYFAYIAFICALLTLVTFIYKKYIFQNICLIILYFGGSVCYALVMYILYMSSFGALEGPPLASFNRYMMSYLFIGSCLVIMIAIELINNNDISKKGILKLLSVLLIILPFINTKSLSDLLITKEYKGTSENEEFLDFIKDIEALNRGTKLLIINQWENDAGTSIMYKYALLYSGIEFNIVALRTPEWHTDFARDISFEEWIELLNNYEYIYMLFPDDHFIEKYWLPLNTVDLYNQGMYRIIKTNEIPELVLE